MSTIIQSETRAAMELITRDWELRNPDVAQDEGARAFVAGEVARQVGQFTEPLSQVEALQSTLETCASVWRNAKRDDAAEREAIAQREREWEAENQTEIIALAHNAQRSTGMAPADADAYARRILKQREGWATDSSSDSGAEAESEYKERKAAMKDAAQAHLPYGARL